MYLSLLEQSPRSRTIYTQLCFCFTAAEPVSTAVIVERLKEGLRILTISFPWLAGRVVQVQSDSYEPYPFRVERFTEIPQLAICDYRNEELVPDLGYMADARFPFSMLGEELFCSRSTLSRRVREDQVYPVLSLQASFLDGGFLLTVEACHSVLDIVGQAQIIKMLSRACHGEEPTVQEIKDGNRDRRGVVTLLEPLTQNEGAATVMDENTTTNGSVTSSSGLSPTLVWSYFTFSSESLTHLKALAQTSLLEESTFVSTDDCVSALLWQSLARSRCGRLNADKKLTFVRQVDVRRYMNVSDGYLGNMVSQTKNVLAIEELCSASLGKIAIQLRRELKPEALRHAVHAQATEQATNSKPHSEQKDRENTITMSSWSKVELHNLDFNLGLEKPVAVRRPQFTPIEGIIYLLPKAVDGEIVAGLCLQSGDMHRLRNDSTFADYAEFIG